MQPSNSPPSPVDSKSGILTALFIFSTNINVNYRFTFAKISLTFLKSLYTLGVHLRRSRFVTTSAFYLQSDNRRAKTIAV